MDGMALIWGGLGATPAAHGCARVPWVGNGAAPRSRKPEPAARLRHHPANHRSAPNCVPARTSGPSSACSPSRGIDGEEREG